MEIEDILNQLDDLIYIADMETNELLFVNTALKNRFHISNIDGLKCYQSLQGRATPCPFCTNEQLKKKRQPIEWEIHNPVIGRHALLKDSLILYQGREARLEIARDITDEESTESKLKHILEMQRIMFDCVKRLNSAEDMKKSISFILEKIGRFLMADRAYIFEIDGPVMNNTYEWCEQGVESQQSFCQNFDKDIWNELVAGQKSIIINDVEDIREISPRCYELLKPQGVGNFVFAELRIDSTIIGFIGVDNPNLRELEHFTILETLSYFIGSSLEHMQMNNKLLHASYYDELTGVFNRNKFIEDTEYFTHYMESSILIVYIDINGLKELNDSKGHQVGDAALRNSAEILTQIFKGANIYRIGGDEFVVFDSNIDEEEAKGKIEKLTHSFLLNSNCTAAIGSVWSADCTQLEKKITNADKLMYQDKMKYYRSHTESARYRVYSDKMIEITKRQVLLEKLATEQFEVYLQPKVDFAEKEIIGAEALIRYHDENGKLIMPNEFIPLIENAKNIHYIDFYVFYTICKKIKKWISEGKTVRPISVNFSRYTLILPDFISYLEDVWKQFEVPKHLIEIEIVENVENINSEFLISIMKRIREAGFPVSIDDFGVRYANMSLFINADLDTLKLDKSLMNDIATNEKSQRVIEAIVKICRDLNIQSIVEGVETEEQFEMLKELNCNGAQGYLFSKPIPIEEFEEKYMKVT